ncbi:MAG TPA: J domain-containing protein, partial [Pirellulales bacterium]|nr:J domain-containing protein [Pirellulales bacterium]
MSAHELPSDLGDWPQNPYQLLGVQPSVEPRDLKRAYTQLIRVYKPEQFPDHFRRLREAYETVLRQVEFRTKYQVRDDEPPAASQNLTRADITPADVRQFERFVNEPEIVSWPARLDQIWETAASGLEEPAYRQFVELEQLHPGHPDLCVRLYWLLALEPRLDLGRDPEDWLAKGLMNVGLSGPLGELYRRRIASHPQEALSERCEKLLAAPATPGLLAAFAEQRWNTAAVLGDAAPLVAADLERLRPAIAAQAEEIWINLVVRAMEYLAWSDDSNSREQAFEYRRQVEVAEHLHRRLEHLFDRMEIVFEIAAIWRESQRRTAHGNVLHRIMRQSRLTDFATTRPQLESELRTALITPSAMLDGLSAVLNRSSVAALAFGELLDIWERACEPPHDFRDPERVQKQILAFVRRTEFWSYSACRES